MENLFRKMLQMRIRPYYLLQADQTRGTAHFWTRIETGLEIMRELRGNLSGLALPTYVVDLPGGGGKVPLLPGYVIRRDPPKWEFRNYQGKRYEITYP